jgi:phage terminase large subunit-like protein
MPHQQYIADVMGEVDPRTGFHAYREGYLTMMRQCGKTTIVVVKKIHRALDTVTGPQTILFAAQDGIEAKQKWLDHAEMVKKSPLRDRLAGPDEPTTSNGKELLTWSNGSTERPLSSKPSSGHGETVDFGVVTEAFALQDARYEATIKPAMYTRPDAQFFAESAEGDATSIYWNEILKTQRERLEAEPTRPSRVAFFDFSADPLNDDLGDPETWKRRIPALDLPENSWRGTIALDTIQHEFDNATTPKKLRAFNRGALNIADLGVAGAGVFEDDAWDDTADDNSQLIGDRAFALDIAPDRTWAAIAWAGVNREGLEHHELIAFERNTWWILEELGKRLAANGVDKVTVVAGTQAALMEDDLRTAGINVRLLSRAEYAAACARYSDGIDDGEWRHLASGQDPLDAAVNAAEWTGGQQRVFASSDDTVTICPLVAVVAAAEGYRLREERINILETIA